MADDRHDQAIGVLVERLIAHAALTAIEAAYEYLASRADRETA